MKRKKSKILSVASGKIKNGRLVELKETITGGVDGTGNIHRYIVRGIPKY